MTTLDQQMQAVRDTIRDLEHERLSTARKAQENPNEWDDLLRTLITRKGDLEAVLHSLQILQDVRKTVRTLLDHTQPDTQKSGNSATGGIMSPQPVPP